MKTNILVIGASGAVCLETIQKLTAMRESVRIGVLNPDKAKAMDLKGVEIIYFDYNNPDTFSPAFESINSWLLISPPAGLKYHLNVLPVIDAALNAGVKNLVNISSLIAEDKDHPMQIIEEYIKNSGSDYAILRPNCYMQRFNDFLRDCIKDECAIRVPAGDKSASFIDMRDVAEAAALLLMMEKLPNEVFTLTGEKAYKLADVADTFTKILSKQIIYEPVSIENYQEMLSGAGWSDLAIAETMQICGNMGSGIASQVSEDISKILGRNATSLESFIQAFAESWK